MYAGKYVGQACHAGGINISSLAKLQITVIKCFFFQLHTIDTV